MKVDKVILTREGYEKLADELTFLKTKKRREVANQLEFARSLGDLRENSEYETAREAKHQLEIKNLDTGDVFFYTLVAQDEADFTKGKISVTSPIGRGLLGKEEGDTAEIQIPAGKVRYKILKISRG